MVEKCSGTEESSNAQPDNPVGPKPLYHPPVVLQLGRELEGPALGSSSCHTGNTTSGGCHCGRTALNEKCNHGHRGGFWVPTNCWCGDLPVGQSKDCSKGD